jgi:hypothetical protein
MGVDFLQRAGKTLKRSWDEGRAAVASRDLLAREPTCAGRSVAADIEQGVRLSAGEAVTVQIEAGALVARRGLTVVARAPDPPAALAEMIMSSCNVRPATVEQVHEMAGTAEINVC